MGSELAKLWSKAKGGESRQERYKGEDLPGRWNKLSKQLGIRDSMACLQDVNQFIKAERDQLVVVQDFFFQRFFRDDNVKRVLS